MSSYYKKINGQSYDREMLEVADRSVAGKGDGRISLSDSKEIIKKAKDGGRITDTELRTLNYILEKYHLTEPALKYIEESLSDELVLKDKGASDQKKPANLKKENKSLAQKKEDKKEDKPLVQTKEYNNENKPVAQKKEEKSGKMKYFLIFLLILAALILFLLFNFVCNKGAVLTEKDDAAAPIVNSDKKADAPKTDNVDDEKSKNSVKINANEYVVKQSDTLVKISEDVYGDYKSWVDIYRANKDKIQNPGVIYPGQVLTIPEKNK
ncbi:MAG: LysM peptidoglycan-binding domain-containing protein [Leptospirales bacterium]|nr:LysM peptidoglycan-binding domain-containing protein [Leptospirales bacterium]